jgi:DNA-directed RNA polymerase subunit RPC12/RpoP
MKYYCKECNEEFEAPINIGADDTDRCPCCFSASVKEYK